MNPLSDLKTRSLSACVLASITLGAVVAGGVVFSALILFAAITMHREWKTLAQKEPYGLYMFGYPYVILPCASLLWLRSLAVENHPLLGLKLVIILGAVISATDIGAYFAGRKLGKHKLCPSISPNKTWEGLMGGVLCASVTAFFSLYILPVSGIATPVVLLGAVTALVAQGGDLFESWIKRRAGVKDSGNILPGHGGLIDRFDGYMFNAPLLALIVYIYL